MRITDQNTVTAKLLGKFFATELTQICTDMRGAEEPIFRSESMRGEMFCLAQRTGHGFSSSQRTGKFADQIFIVAKRWLLSLLPDAELLRAFDREPGEGKPHYQAYQNSRIIELAQPPNHPARFGSSCSGGLLITLELTT